VKRKRRISWATRSIDCNSLLWVVENWTSWSLWKQEIRYRWAIAGLPFSRTL
jgi:hypothetical protein